MSIFRRSKASLCGMHWRHLTGISAFSGLIIMSFWDQASGHASSHSRSPRWNSQATRSPQHQSAWHLMIANNKFHITKFLNNGTRKWRLELKFPNWLAGLRWLCFFNFALNMYKIAPYSSSQTCSIQVQLILRMSFWQKIITIFWRKIE